MDFEKSPTMGGDFCAPRNEKAPAADTGAFKNSPKHNLYSKDSYCNPEAAPLAKGLFMGETFQDAIRAAGWEPPEHIVPGKLFRFPGRGKPRSNRDAWGRLFGDGTGGVVGEWGTDFQLSWQAKRERPYTAQEKAEWQRQLKAAKLQQLEVDKEEKIRQKEKSLKAWQSASPAGEHPYLAAKGIKSHGLRTDGRNLLIPVIDIHGTFQGYQWIGPEGHKGFSKGCQKKGSYFLIGEPVDGEMIYAAEGYATAVTTYEGKGQAVAVAFDAGNLKDVALALHKKYPNSQKIIAADNDQWTEGNPGLKHAQEAAEAVGGAVIFPTFTEEAIARFKAKHGKGPTDFNDLHQLEGLAEVEKQMNNRTNHTESYPTKLILNNTALTSLPALPRATEEISENLKLPNSTNSTKTAPKQHFTDKNSNHSSFGGALVEEGKKGLKLVIASKAAREIAKVLKGQFAYDTESGVWHAFTGACWAAEATPVTLHRELTDWLYVEADPVGFTPGYMDSALVLIQRAGMLSLPEQHDLIPFANGLLNPATRELVKTAPNNALTWSLPYNYSPSAACPFTQDWLREVSEDEDTVQLLRAFMAALIRGPAKYQRFLHLIGPGGNGKSTLIRLPQLLVGEQNTVSTDLRQLEQNRFETAKLYRKRLAMITDSDKYGGAINTLKAATGQDPLRLERKHVQQAGSFIFDGLVLMASNEALTTTDYSSALERRRVTVPFEKRITEEDKAHWNERGGEDRLRAEIPGLVNWLLDMPIEEMERAIAHPPARVVKANTEAMRDSNPVADWVMENCIPALGVWTQVGVKNEIKDMGRTHFWMADDHLYPNYLRWCLQNGREPLSVRRFRPKVVDVLKNCLRIDVMEYRRNSGIGLQGIQLRNENEPVHEWLKNSQ